MSITITNIIPILSFWLIFTRLFAINFQLPIYDNLRIPMIVKALSTLVLTFTFYPYVKDVVVNDIKYIGSEHFWILTVFYTVVGIVIGFLVKSIMMIFSSSGSLITQSIGFSMVSYFDVSSKSQVGPFEKIIQWTLLVIVISSGALLPIFKGAYGSFFSINMINIGSLAISDVFYVKLFNSIFLTSIMLATPLIFMNMLIMCILGIVSRIVPQLNVIMVSFVVNIGLGLLIFIVTSDEYFNVAFKIYTEKLGEWFNFIL